jgi:hypothetical protein
MNPPRDYPRPTFTDRLAEYLAGYSWLPLAILAVVIFGLVFFAVIACQAQEVPVPARVLTASFYSVQSLKQEGTWKTSKGVMANGQKFDEDALTCATRLYPLGSVLMVSTLDRRNSISVKVTDRIGKRFATKRIDLSKAAFARLAPLSKGLVQVTVERIN